MTARFDDTIFNHSYADDDPLVRRLRELEWPGVDAELRERCWGDFVRRLEDPESARELEHKGVPEATRRSVARRQDFSRRLPSGAERLGTRLAGYTSSRWAWERRPLPRVATLAG